MMWGWSLKAVTNNNQIALLIMEYPFLRLASAQKMPFLPADSCRRFLMRAFSLVARVLCGMPSTRAQSRWLGTSVIFSGKGALKVSITLMALRFLSVVFACGKAGLQLVFIRQEDCSQTNL